MINDVKFSFSDYEIKITVIILNSNIKQTIFLVGINLFYNLK